MEGGFENAGRVSSQVKAFLATLDFPKDIIRRAAIVTLEAEMNICSYAHRGHITIRILPHFITIEAVDEGQGIHDIELAMKEGYSTASDRIREMGFGAGMGLPNMKKCSDDFYIDSVLGRGTSIIMKIFLKDGD